MIMCHTMVSRIFAFLVWAACAAGLAYWGLRWLAKPLPVPAHSATVSMTVEPKGNMAQLLTAPEADPDAAGPTAEQSALAARIQLIGLMAANNGSGPGVALLAVDGKPAKAYRVGQAIDGEQVVQAITRQGVDIGLPGQPATATLPAQTLPPAATGTLPSAMPDTPPVNSATANSPPPAPMSPSVFQGRRLPPVGSRADNANSSQTYSSDGPTAGETPSGTLPGGDMSRSGRTADGTKFRVMPL